MKIEIEKWMVELKQELIKHYSFKQDVSLSVDDWKVYFDDGLSPQEAIEEDFRGG